MTDTTRLETGRMTAEELALAQSGSLYQQALLDAAREEGRREEREACAKWAARQVGDWNFATDSARQWHMDNVAAAIRARADHLTGKTNE